jgi:hypothetical protein
MGAEPRRAAGESGRERQLSAPLVLAMASGMIAVAVVVWFGRGPAPEPPAPERSDGGRIDDSTPERVAEGFYDAWRRRRWPPALSVSVGAARAAVAQKQARDESLAPEDRVVMERMWDALARAPLTLRLDEAEMEPAGALRLHGVAEYALVNRPYRRRVEFLVVPGSGDSEGRFRVAEMRLGDVLTELPDMFRQGSGEPPP